MKALLRILLVNVILLSLLQAKQIAIFIANDDYKSIKPLGSAKRDADAFAKALVNVGWTGDIVKLYDKDEKSLRQEIRKVAEKTKLSSHVIIFYAGHGSSLHGKNYLIPTDAKLSIPEDIAGEAVSVDWVTASIKQKKGGSKIVILDCCRNVFGQKSDTNLNALQQPAKSTVPDRSLIIYSGPPGKTVKDGGDTHSPFAKAILDSIASCGKLTTFQYFANLEKKSGKQQPWMTFGGSTESYNKLNSINLLGGTPIGGQGGDSVWLSNIEEAVQYTSQTMVFFDAPWCPKCRDLNQSVVIKPEFANATTKMSLVRLLYPRKNVSSYARKVAAKYNVRSYPTILILDKNGDILRRHSAINYSQPLKLIKKLTFPALRSGEAGYLMSKRKSAKIWTSSFNGSDFCSWSGKLDSADYAVGKGTLSWYSNNKFSHSLEGTMKKGKFNGSVLKIDKDGQASKVNYNNGKKL